MADQKPLLQQLIEALRILPSVGPKSAQRMAYHLLERNREGGRVLASLMLRAMDDIQHCERCRDLCETPLCKLCANPQRDDSRLCIVEMPVDLQMIEQSTGYRGRYFVLGGRLSPLDGIGPAEIGLDKLKRILAAGEVRELILATNPTVEGEATAHYIGDMASGFGIEVSRIAHGVPLGGELEFVDSGTLAHAFADRKKITP